MSVTSAQLITRLGGSDSDEATVTEATRVLALATQYVTDYVASQRAAYEIAADPPEPLLDEAVLRCAVDLFSRAAAPNGVLMTAYDDSGNGSSTPVRIARDPLWSVRDALAGYLPATGGFA